MDNDTDGKETPQQTTPPERVVQEFKEFELKSDAGAAADREQAMPSAPAQAPADRAPPEQKYEAAADDHEEAAAVPVG